MRLNEAKQKLGAYAYEQIKRKLKVADDTDTDPTADTKPHSRHAPMAKVSPTLFDTKVCVRVHSIRRRLSDEENLYAKYVIDAIRYAGVLTDDSPKYVTGPFHTEEIGYPEETIITIEPVER